MKLTLILLLLITSLMAVVGAFLTTSVSGFYINTFYEQMNDVFGSDRREFVGALRMEAAQPDGADRTLFTCYVGDGNGEEKIAAISRISGDKPAAIANVHSFVEDFWRNGASKDLVRRAEFTNFRAKSPSVAGDAAPTGAAFTADENTLKTIDAGPVPGGAFLQTGGATSNATVQVFSIFPVTPL